jgi:hypothetical protein
LLDKQEREDGLHVEWDEVAIIGRNFWELPAEEASQKEVKPGLSTGGPRVADKEVPLFPRGRWISYHMPLPRGYEPPVWASFYMPSDRENLTLEVLELHRNVGFNNARPPGLLADSYVLSHDIC